jgi:hypothetical protein
VIRRFPDAVLCGPTAAQLTFWPALKHDTVRVANVRARFGHPGYRWERRVVPPEWVEARTANHLVRIRGRTYYLDIAFVAQHVAVEIDGRLHERAGRAGSRRVCDPGRAQASRLKRSGRQVRRRAGCTTLPAI